ncbi:shikimate dehydrogenase [Salegentibacter salinarum]|uniref:Shikimate dehydrogenase n=1 Tax=Salegentibacter salinarum TaxID=447422 RepID=A0A2N0TZM0_9FLAO|nr:shikimate dehydrogenase [Salegentibacter salinarum]PKD20192.1 shikimate dehydrogenase [Salegentibacter salinarum]SKB86921.1 shikimate dehydrogenase [Salegentibacter salinarum]
MKNFGLIGKNISYSFSRTYFTEKFKKENIEAEYQNFDLDNLKEFRDVIKETPNLQGLNVTIPYKQEIISFLDDLAPEAKEIGAVNTINVNGNKLIGYNTDYIGFSESLKPFLKEHHKKALILGTGGASKAVAYALKNFSIDYKFVSRSSGEGKLGYDDLSEKIMKEYSLIINTTPVGTYPDVDAHPEIPFKFITSQHLVYDLIYNPRTTKLMARALAKGATVTDGLKMLELQAESAWKIWTK